MYLRIFRLGKQKLFLASALYGAGVGTLAWPTTGRQCGAGQIGMRASKRNMSRAWGWAEEKPLSDLSVAGRLCEEAPQSSDPGRCVGSQNQVV